MITVVESIEVSGTQSNTFLDFVTGNCNNLVAAPVEINDADADAAGAGGCYDSANSCGYYECKCIKHVWSFGWCSGRY